MIPPLSQDDLDQYPAFAEIWEHVTQNLLDGDGATRRRKDEREEQWRDTLDLAGVEEHAPGPAEAGPEVDGAVDEDVSRRAVVGFESEVYNSRVRRMKRLILLEALSEVAYSPVDGQEGNAPGAKTTSRIPISSKREALGLTDTNIVAAELAEIEVKGTNDATRQNKGISGRLRDLILIISEYLQGVLVDQDSRFTAEEEELLADDIELFEKSLPVIAAALSTHLIEQEASLLNLSNLAIDSNNEAMQPFSSLSESFEHQMIHQRHLQTEILPESLSTLTSTLQTLLRLQRDLLYLQLQHLETSKHGIIARHNASKMTFLSTVAQTMALKTMVLVLEARKEVEISPQAELKREEIRIEMGRMCKEEERLNVRIEELKRVLKEYKDLDGAGLEVMKKLGQRYKEIQDEKDVVNMDIVKLERTRKR